MVTTLNPDSAKVGSQVGRSVPRLEGRDKVTGRAEYTHTMRLPGMLVAKIFRSTVAHGRIKSVNTSAAKRFPSVLHVVTIDDVKQVIQAVYAAQGTEARCASPAHSATRAPASVKNAAEPDRHEQL